MDFFAKSRWQKSLWVSGGMMERKHEVMENHRKKLASEKKAWKQMEDLLEFVCDLFSHILNGTGIFILGFP